MRPGAQARRTTASARPSFPPHIPPHIPPHSRPRTPSAARIAVPSLPTIVLLGAPGTGAQALCAALQQRLPPGAARWAWGHALSDVAGALQGAEGAPATVLLMGLDLPCAAAQRPAQESADAGLRAALARAGMAYRVVYGLEDRRVASALDAIKNIASFAFPSSARRPFPDQSAEAGGRTARLRAWHCEKCSDPECEYRLFTALTGHTVDPA